MLIQAWTRNMPCLHALVEFTTKFTMIHTSTRMPAPNLHLDTCKHQSLKPSCTAPSQILLACRSDDCNNCKGHATHGQRGASLQSHDCGQLRATHGQQGRSNSHPSLADAQPPAPEGLEPMTGICSTTGAHAKWRVARLAVSGSLPTVLCCRHVSLRMCMLPIVRLFRVCCKAHDSALLCAGCVCCAVAIGDLRTWLFNWVCHVRV